MLNSTGAHCALKAQCAGNMRHKDRVILSRFLSPQCVFIEGPGMFPVACISAWSESFQESYLPSMSILHALLRIPEAEALSCKAYLPPVQCQDLNAKQSRCRATTSTHFNVIWDHVLRNGIISFMFTLISFLDKTILRSLFDNEMKKSICVLCTHCVHMHSILCYVMFLLIRFECKKTNHLSLSSSFSSGRYSSTKKY